MSGIALDYEEDQEIFGDWSDANLGDNNLMDAVDGTDPDANCAAALRAAKLIDDVEMVVVQV